jgi:GTP diphosphokinase / guanosine-3',5'-bis(diphosphate) 3'-diphosphatase
MDPPDFVRRSPLVRGAYELALDAHHGPRRKGETDIGHPLAVAELLDERGFDDEIVAAALLHDVVEATTTELSEIEARFGGEVRRLVEEMTENEAIEPYESRKAEHRSRVAAADRSAAAIYIADKLANIRALRADPSSVPREKLDHYVATVEILCEAHPELPFLQEVQDELERLQRQADAG